MSDDVPPPASPPLDYQSPRDAGTDPWVPAARGVAWAAAVYAGATTLVAAFSLLYRWEVTGEAWRDPVLAFSVLSKVFYVPVVVAGIACARLSRTGWVWLTRALAVVIVVQILTLLAVCVAVPARSLLRTLGHAGFVALIGQQVFAGVAQTAPLVLMYWLLTRRDARLVFLPAGHQPTP